MVVTSNEMNVYYNHPESETIQFDIFTFFVQNSFGQNSYLKVKNNIPFHRKLYKMAFYL